MAEFDEKSPEGFRTIVTPRFSGMDKLGQGFRQMAAANPVVVKPTPGAKRDGTNLNASERATNELLELLKETKGQGGIEKTMAAAQPSKHMRASLRPWEQAPIKALVGGVYAEAWQRDVALLKRIYHSAIALKDTPYVAENCVGTLFSRMSTLEGAAALNTIFTVDCADKEGISAAAAKTFTRLECRHEGPWQQRFGCDDNLSEFHYGHRTRTIKPQEYKGVVQPAPESLPLGHPDRPKGVYTAPLEPMPVPCLSPRPSGPREVIDVAEMERRLAEPHPKLSDILRDVDRAKRECRGSRVPGPVATVAAQIGQELRTGGGTRLPLPGTSVVPPSSEDEKKQITREVFDTPGEGRDYSLLAHGWVQVVPGTSWKDWSKPVEQLVVGADGQRRMATVQVLQRKEDGGSLDLPITKGPL